MNKILEADLLGKGVVGQDNTPNLTSLEMQEKVEEIVRTVVIPKFNANVEGYTQEQAITLFHISSTENPHQLTKAQVGLGNADNTSDMDKPVSAPQAVALATKSDKSTTYTKLEVDNIAGKKANSTDMETELSAKASLEYVRNEDIIASQGAKVYSDMQNAVLQKDILDNLIYKVAYFDPLDGAKKSLQEILDNLSLIQTQAYSWSELEVKDLTCETIDGMELSWENINNGGW